MHSRRSISLAALFAALLVGACAATAVAASNSSSTHKGAKWIAKSPLSAFSETGFRADAIEALTAARKSGHGVAASATKRFTSAVASDAANYATTAGATGKTMLAAVAAGRNPQCFGPSTADATDLYALENTFYKNGRYGDTAFDQAFAMLGIVASDHKVPKAAIKFVKKQRGSHGWGFSLAGSSGDDVESTAILIEALRAAGVPKSDAALKSAYKWITFQRNSDGGYNPSTAAGETQADTTAFAIRAGEAMGKNTNNAKRALRALQLKNGSFRGTPSAPAASPALATNDAVLALSGRHYPVVTRSKPGKSCG